MPAPGEQKQPVHPHQILGAWGQPLLKGRRVAVLGDTSTGLSEQLAELTGRRVHAYDPDTTRAAASLAEGRSGKVTYGSIDSDLDLRRGAYDAVVVPDLAAMEDAKASISHARELLSRRGILVLLSDAANGPGYYELYDLVADAFEEVTMLGQAPFAGFTVAAFGSEGEPAVLIDSSLMASSEEPRSFMVVAGDQPTETEPYTLVQLPARVAGAWMEGPRPELADARELAEARLEGSLMREELRKLKDLERERAQLLKDKQHLEKSLSMRVAELERELSAHQTKAAARTKRDAQQIASLEQQLSLAQQQPEQLRAQQEEQLSNAEEAFQDELDTMLDRIAELEEELAGAQSAATAAGAKAEQAAKATARAEQAAKKSSEAAAEAKAQARQAEAGAEERIKKVEASAEERVKEVEAGAEERIKQAEAGAEERVKQAEAGAEERALQQEQPAQSDESTDERELSAQAYAFQINELRDALDKARQEADALRAREGELTALQAQVSELQEQLEQHQGSAPPDEQEQHAADIDRMERRLLERGALIDKLRKELRESERTGRELVAELLEAQKQQPAASTAPPSPGAPAASPAQDAPQSSDHEGLLMTLESSPESSPQQLRPQLDSLLQRCSRYEADLQAASWKIDSLTAELEQLQSDATPDQIKLETALRDAHEELAKLRDSSPQRERG